MTYNFVLHKGDPESLIKNDTYLCFNAVGTEIYFSAAQLGNAMTCHFTTDKAGLRQIKEACEDFCAYIFRHFGWCRMIIAYVLRPSVGRMIEKIGFVKFAKSDEGVAYMRVRPWAE